MSQGTWYRLQCAAGGFIPIAANLEALGEVATFGRPYLIQVLIVLTFRTSIVATLVRQAMTIVGSASPSAAWQALPASNEPNTSALSNTTQLNFSQY